MLDLLHLSHHFTLRVLTISMSSRAINILSCSKSCVPLCVPLHHIRESDIVLPFIDWYEKRDLTDYKRGRKGEYVQRCASFLHATLVLYQEQSSRSTWSPQRPEGFNGLLRLDDSAESIYLGAPRLGGAASSPPPTRRRICVTPNKYVKHKRTMGI